MRDFQTRVDATEMQVNNEQIFVDKTFNEIKHILIGLMRRIIIVGEITKVWNHVQRELKLLSEEMATLCELQMAL